MAFDAYFLGEVLAELKQRVIGSRVEKIHQPARDTVVLLLRCETGREKLLICPNPAAPRLYLTKTSPENPAQPTMFCMLLRKHLSGARLAEIYQLPMERVAVFTFDATDEMGYPVEKRLVAELMGRTCNLYLLDSSGRIVDCLRRVGLDEISDRARPALPGLLYQFPEQVQKRDPKVVTDFLPLLTEPGADVLAERLMDGLGGLSPLVCREAALFAAGSVDARLSGADKEEVSQRLLAFFSAKAVPCYTEKQFAFCPIWEYGGCQQAESFSGLLDLFYTERNLRDVMQQKSQAVRKNINNLCQRLTRKLAIQQKELTATYDRERLRQLGDIVTANLHRITKGQQVLKAEDFYDEEMKTVEIALSPLLSPQQNAAKYYKDYARMKTAEKELTKQMALAQQELSYLQSVLDELNRAATEAELEEIRGELVQGGYLKKDTAKKQARKLPPMQFTSTDGFSIYVGKNNRQNEELTFRTARKDDLWLHAQKVHGSHVIIACAGRKVPDDTVTQAAQLAAFYSQAGGGQNVPVDVTPVKQVKKLPGAQPGMVIYHSYNTVVVNPYKEIVVDELNREKK